MRCYKLVGRIPVPCELKEAEMWLDDVASRRIWYTKLPDCEVSTMFLVIDRNHNAERPPLLFESAISGGPHNDFSQLYSTWKEAAKGHTQAVRIARGEIEED